MRAGNPTLNENTFNQFGPKYGTYEADMQRSQLMTAHGTAFKTMFLLLLVVGTASITWYLAVAGNALVFPLMWGGLIVALIAAVVTTFKQEWAPVTTLIYALAEGLALGGISAFFEGAFQGIVIQAIGLTLGVMACMLIAYVSGLVKATETFKMGVIAATGGIGVVYLISFVMRAFFHSEMPYIHGTGTIGVGFSLFVVVIAAMNLVLDFDLIERGAEQGAPKYMEWYAAFGLLVTLVWLYIEILRLLSKLRRR